MAPMKTYRLKFWSKTHATPSEREMLEAKAHVFTGEL